MKVVVTCYYGCYRHFDCFYTIVLDISPVILPCLLVIMYVKSLGVPQGSMLGPVLSLSFEMC